MGYDLRCAKSPPYNRPATALPGAVGGGEGGAYYFVVVSDVYVFVRVCRVRPADAVSLGELAFCGLYKVCSADFVESFRAQGGDYELAPFVEHPDFVVVSDHVNVGPSCLRYSRKVFPYAVACQKVQASEFAVAVHTIDVIALEDGGGYAAVEAVGFSFAIADASPHSFGGQFVGVQFEEHRSVIETAYEQVIVAQDGRCDVYDHSRGIHGLSPVDFAGLRVHTDNRVARPADEDSLVRLVDYDRRRIRSVVIEPTPDFFARNFVEGDEAGVVFAADLNDEEIVFYEW